MAEEFCSQPFAVKLPSVLLYVQMVSILKKEKRQFD